MVKLILGDHSYGTIKAIGATSKGKIIVGKYCSIALRVRALMAGDHNFDVISTFPFFHEGFPITDLIRKPPLPETQFYNAEHKFEIVIGNDVWIGYGAVLFRDVNVGDGAVIGAFSTITKDIPPYSIAVGHSRIVRKRFSDEDIEFLLKLKWWDLPDQEVADIAPILHNPNIELLKQWAKENNKI